VGEGWINSGEGSGVDQSQHRLVVITQDYMGGSIELDVEDVADDRASLFSDPQIGSGDKRLLFNEMPYSSVPGNLHLSSDEAIERFIGRHGRVNVVRQLARDLAEREAEVGLLRRQNEDRERELRKMLVECGVSWSDIDKRLMNMTATSMRKPDIVINELMGEALESKLDEDEVEENGREEEGGGGEEEAEEDDEEEGEGDVTLETVVEKPPPPPPPSSEVENNTRSRSQSTRSWVGYILRKDENAGGAESSEHATASKRGGQGSVASESNIVSSSASTSSYQDHGPMELNDIVPQNIQPPTLLQSWNDHYGSQQDYLTDRYGFIYDRKRRKPKEHDDGENDNEANNVEAESVRSVSSSMQQLPPAPPQVMPEQNGIQLSTSQPVTQTQTMASSQKPKTPGSSVRMLLAQLTDMHDGVQKAQTAKWDEFFRKVNSEPVISRGQLLGVSGAQLREAGNGKTLWKEFKELVSQGVPVAYRPKIWGECSGAWTLKEPGTYDNLLNRTGEAEEALGQIELDLYRTMPYNVFFGGNGPGVAKLRRVLVAFSRWNPQVGYCQGMNVIAAILLLTYATEEDAFWSLVSLVENILPEGYFSPPLLTSRADQRVFNHYFARFLPKLNEHFTNLNVQIDAITFDWFLSCFTDALPADVLFRIWDVFLCVEGPVHLFRIALALFRIHERQLLDLKTGAEIYSFMKNLVNQPVRVTELTSQANAYYNQITDKDLRSHRQNEINILKRSLNHD
jgi:hypothetical protein